MIDIRARNFENAAAPGTALKSVTYTVRVTYNEVPMPRTKPADKPKMGRPRKVDNVVRKSRGVRIHPELLEVVDEAIDCGYIPGVSNFSEAVELALTKLVKFKAKAAAK